jgi:hypothetical protein
MRMSLVLPLAAVAGLLSATAAPVTGQLSASGSIGALGLHASSIEYDGFSDAGNFFGVGGELLVNRRLVGVAQGEMLQASSLSTSAVSSGFAVMGGLGIRFGIPGIERASVDLMGYGGYAQFSYEGGGTFTDASPQFGFGLTPRFRLTNRLALTLSARVLSGADAGEGTAIDRTDFGIGGWFRVF